LPYLEYSGRVNLNPIDIQICKRIADNEFHPNTRRLDLTFKHFQSTLDHLQGLRIDWSDLDQISNETKRDITGRTMSIALSSFDSVKTSSTILFWCCAQRAMV
jgi:hypothetical protein